MSEALWQTVARRWLGATVRSRRFAGRGPVVAVALVGKMGPAGRWPQRAVLTVALPEGEVEVPARECEVVGPAPRADLLGG